MGFDKDLLIKEANFGMLCELMASYRAFLGNITNARVGTITTQGLSLREMIHEFKHQILVLFKALLLQPKVRYRTLKCQITDHNRFALAC